MLAHLGYVTACINIHFDVYSEQQDAFSFDSFARTSWWRWNFQAMPGSRPQLLEVETNLVIYDRENFQNHETSDGKTVEPN